MSAESAEFQREIRNQFAAFKQLATERTEQILAAIARRNEVRDRVEQRLEQLEASVSRLNNRVTRIEGPK